MLVKDLILSNPELPLIVVVRKDDSGDFYGFGDIYENPEGYIGEMLQHDDFVGQIFLDYEDLEYAVYDKFSNELSNEELEVKAAEYASYWEKSIILEL